MNRGRIAGLVVAVAAACCAAPALAKDALKPSLSLDPIIARGLLAPVDEARTASAGYRLDPGLEPVSGQRARLSVEVGESTLFAITGRLGRQPLATGPLDPGHARALGQRRADGGKVYGAGVSRHVGPVDLSATYQYSKLRPETGGDEGLSRDFGPGKSHSLRATARIRFSN